MRDRQVSRPCVVSSGTSGINGEMVVHSAWHFRGSQGQPAPVCSL